VWGGVQVASADEEQILIARATGGDRGAYELLLERSVRPATHLAFAMLHDRSEAEDAFQESALRAWRRLGNLRAGSRFQPWFIGIVANQCRETRRGRWWRTLRVPDLRVAEQGDAVADWLEGEALRRAVAALPHDQRVAVILHFHLDMPLSDVGVALGISQAGVKTRINRALKRLRPAMGAAKVNANG
jgi:RNA polymerase sigma-70 factor (ECF subfamily)